MGIGDGDSASSERSREIIAMAKAAFDSLGANDPVARGVMQQSLLANERDSIARWQEDPGASLGRYGAFIETKSFRGKDTLARIGAIISLLEVGGIPMSDVLVRYNPSVNSRVYDGSGFVSAAEGEQIEVGSISISFETLKKLRAVHEEWQRATQKRHGV
jgi:hypothetical protein